MLFERIFCVPFKFSHGLSFCFLWLVSFLFLSRKKKRKKVTKNFYIMYLKTQITLFTQSNYFHSGEVRLHDKFQFIEQKTPMAEKFNHRSFLLFHHFIELLYPLLCNKRVSRLCGVNTVGKPIFRRSFFCGIIQKLLKRKKFKSVLFI